MAGRLQVTDIKSRKGGLPLVCLTAYSAPAARLLDPHVDLLLVGDSLGNVLYGFDDTTFVTLDMMIAHGRAVARAAQRACVVVDMPFGTYEDSPEQAYENAARLMRETGGDAVKLEGGQGMARTVENLVKRGIPVMGHIGLQPQSAPREGGYSVKGKTDADEQRLMDDAKALEAAGAFALVIEATIAGVAAAITRAVSIPTIGIGAGADCDGQILVTDDMLGLHGGRVPKFVKAYAALADNVAHAAAAYAEDVRARRFPAEAHTYKKTKQQED